MAVMVMVMVMVVVMVMVMMMVVVVVVVVIKNLTVNMKNNARGDIGLDFASGTQIPDTTD